MKWTLNLRRFFRKRLKIHRLDQKYRVVVAFELDGIKYFMFDNQFEVPADRQMAALAIYEEMNMRCTAEYLKMHTRAMDKIMSDPKKVNLSLILQLNLNLKERLDLMPLPDFVYKLASVVFFDESESPYSYDYEYAEKKIAKWKTSGGTYDFFSRTALKDLIPSLTIADASTPMYFQVANQIEKIHLRHLTDILSAKA